MSKRGILILLVVALMSLGVGAAGYLLGWLGPLREPDLIAQKPANGERTVKEALTAASETAAALLGEQAPGSRGGKAERAKAPIDVARINPAGTSVIAGHAQPNEKLTLLADGEPIAAANADDTGAWVVVTDHAFKSKDPQLEVASADRVAMPKPKQVNTATSGSAPPAPAPPQAAAPASATDTVRGPPASAAAPTAPTEAAPSANVRAVTQRLMADFERLVETAKKERDDAATQDAQSRAREAGARPSAQAPPTPSAPAASAVAPIAKPPAPSASASVAVATTAPATDLRHPNLPVASPNAGAAAAGPGAPAPAEPGAQTLPPGTAQSATAAAAAPSGQRLAAAGGPPQSGGDEPYRVASERGTSAGSIPIPVLFVYNEATFTDEGRRAATLLLEYLKLKHPDRVTLTGHADERGTAAFNMELSRERLAAVRAFLERGGYRGALTLLPRGESEPFLGIDRTRFSQEELFQLDRRVELRLTP